MSGGDSADWPATDCSAIGEDSQYTNKLNVRNWKGSCAGTVNGSRGIDGDLRLMSRS